MKKFLRIGFLLLVVAFAAIQFFQPKKNQGEITSDHLFENQNVPEDIKAILKTSCLDCHSNQTNYRWYDNIAPASWLVNNHVTEGKAHLNLSEWGQTEMLDQIVALDNICEEIEEGNMPLKSYLMLYPKAKLSEEEKARLCEWTEELSLELMIKLEE